MKKARILIADDDYIFCELTKYILTENRFSVSLSNDSRTTLNFLKNDCCDIILLDLYFPDYQTGIKTLKSLKEINKDIPIIVITSDNLTLINRFNEIIQNGAYDIIEKPLHEERLLLTVNNALRLRHLAKNCIFSNTDELIYLIGQSPLITQVKDEVYAEVISDNNLIIYGDPGTGVMNIVNKIHQNSRRSDHPLLTIDCSKLTFKDMNIELFGDPEISDFEEKYQKLKIVQANKSTLLIANVHLLPIKAQEKLVRTLSGRKLKSLGGRCLAELDVKIIFTTNKENLTDNYKANLASLLLDICQEQLIIPSLNERIDDIPLIVDHLISKYNKTTDSNVTIDNSALTLLQRHNWSENITELKKVILRILHQIENDEITNRDISFPEDLIDPFVPLPYKQAIKNFEKSYLTQIMEYKEWNLNNAAHVLNIDRSNLFKKLQKHGIKIKKHI